MNHTLALVNACFNAIAATFLITGYTFIRKGKRRQHRACMLSAFASSCCFLAGYLTRIALYGDTHFAHGGLFRVFYLVVLISHVSLAFVTVPLVLRTLYLALRGRFEQHRKIARWTFPIWTYVSITGVLVYVLLHVV